MIRRLLRLAFVAAKFCLGQLGFEVFRRRDDHHYVSRVYGHRAGKHLDVRSLEPFGELARESIMGKRTLLYYDRLYIIYQGLKQTVKAGYGYFGFTAAEVGVFKGGTTRFMIETVKSLGVRKQTLHAFDTFDGHAAADISREGLDASHGPGMFGETSLDDVKRYLQELPVVLHKGRVQDTAFEVTSLEFHFVHLDVDIYEPMRFALCFFGDRLASSGVMVVDDYGFRSCPGTKRAVDEFCEARPDFMSFHLLSGQCLLWKTRVSFSSNGPGEVAQRTGIT